MTDQELISRVSVEVMGWVKGETLGITHAKSHFWFLPNGEETIFPFNPLTNANHWMMVVERMRELGFDFQCYATSNFNVTPVIEVSFWKHGFLPGKKMDKDLGHAVCEAALKAVG